MNSSVKTTAFTMLTAAALGAAVWMGCTTTSGTTGDDGDAGDGTGPGKEGNQGNGGPDGAADGGPDTAAPACEISNQKSQLDSEECQTCLEGSCCSALKSCFDIAVEADAGKLDCNGYVDCYEGCQKDTNPDKCVTDDCDGNAATGVAAAFKEIITCHDTTCKDHCDK